LNKRRVKADGATTKLGPEFFPRRLVGDDQQVGQGGLVLQQNAELEQCGVATADLGQANQLGCAKYHLMRRQSAIAGGQQQSRHGVNSRFEGCDVSPRLLELHAPRGKTLGEVLAEPAVGSCQVVPQPGMRYGQADRATQHGLPIEKDRATAGAALQDLHARGRTARQIDNLGHPAPQTQADDDRGRCGNVPALQVRPAWLDIIEECFVSRERFARRLGW
jgi:hypothetical protein